MEMTLDGETWFVVVGDNPSSVFRFPSSDNPSSVRLPMMTSFEMDFVPARERFLSSFTIIIIIVPIPKSVDDEFEINGNSFLEFVSVSPLFLS